MIFTLKFRDLTFAPAKWVCNTVFFSFVSFILAYSIFSSTFFEYYSKYKTVFSYYYVLLLFLHIYHAPNAWMLLAFASNTFDMYFDVSYIFSGGFLYSPIGPIQSGILGCIRLHCGWTKVFHWRYNHSFHSASKRHLSHWGKNPPFIQKFTFSKSHFSQNSQFQNLSFD